jgi:hypothetical protein
VSADLLGPAQAIARLEARVEALEGALHRRSAELRLIQRHICLPDLVLVSRILQGLPPTRGTYDPAFWTESTDVEEADVEETLGDLWVAVAPRGAAGDA